MATKTSNKDSRPFATERKPFQGANLRGETLPNGYQVVSYATPVLVFYDGNWYETETKYSPTTSKQLGQVRPFEKWSRVPQAQFDEVLKKASKKK